MPDAQETQVLIAGAGPIGLTAAIELTRRGIDCRIVDPLLEPPQYAKAVGVQPRTLEVFEGMGVLGRILDAAIEMRGQIVYVNGEKSARLDMTLPADVPFGFIAIPQYATERILREELATRHPPTGAQGMNTGVQDAHNLAWKLALAVSGHAAPGLLNSYDAERRPVGEEVVGRTVRSAREGIGADSTGAAVAAAHSHMDVYLIAAPGADVAGTVLPLVRDTRGEFARAYSASGSAVYIVRPDGYLAFAAAGIDLTGLVGHLRATFA